MLERLSDEDIMREYSIKNIVRYNVRARIKDETVSDHTCFVAILCLKILKQLEINDAELYKSVLTMALLHDVPESITSDFPYNIKKDFPELKKTLGAIEEEYYKKYWPDYKVALDANFELPKAIVKLADIYSVYQYTKNEITLGNHNEEMVDIFEDAKVRINNMVNEINKILTQK